MAKELQFIGDTTHTDLTVTAKVYDVDGAQVDSDVSCLEIGSSAIYIGDMVPTSPGEYTVRFYSDSIVVAFGTILWDGTKEVTIDFIKNILEGDVIPTENQFSILHKDSKVVLVQKGANEVDGLIQLTE
jgi:hypothetical protein